MKRFIEYLRENNTYKVTQANLHYYYDSVKDALKGKHHHGAKVKKLHGVKSTSGLSLHQFAGKETDLGTIGSLKNKK